MAEEADIYNSNNVIEYEFGILLVYDIEHTEAIGTLDTEA